MIEGKEPEEEEIWAYIGQHRGISYWNAREALRELAYGGKPPEGYTSWGEYWKNQ